MEYLDKLAETVVKEAIEKLLADGKRPHSLSVPAEAERLLVHKARGRVPQADAQKRVQQAIDRLRDRKEIKAPRARYNDWALISYKPQLGATS